MGPCSPRKALPDGKGARRDPSPGRALRRRSGCTRRHPGAIPSDDLANRRFTADEPDRLWITNITEHLISRGKMYLTVVVEPGSRRVVGWSIANYLHTELVTDASDMAIWRPKPKSGSGLIHHTDHGTQHKSSAFGQRLRTARLMGSMGLSATPSTMPWLKASSPPSNPTPRPQKVGDPHRTSPNGLRITSKRSTTPKGDTPRSKTCPKTCHPSNTNTVRPLKRQWHEQHTKAAGGNQGGRSVTDISDLDEVSLAETIHQIVLNETVLRATISKRVAEKRAQVSRSQKELKQRIFDLIASNGSYSFDSTDLLRWCLRRRPQMT